MSLLADRRFELGPVPAGTLRRRSRPRSRRRCATSSATRSSTPPPARARAAACVERAAAGAACASSSTTTGPGSRPTSASASSTASIAPTPRATAPRGGTGLGLAIVRAIAEAHGGRVARRGVAEGARASSSSCRFHRALSPAAARSRLPRGPARSRSQRPDRLRARRDRPGGQREGQPHDGSRASEGARRMLGLELPRVAGGLLPAGGARAALAGALRGALRDRRGQQDLLPPTDPDAVARWVTRHRPASVRGEGEPLPDAHPAAGRHARGHRALLRGIEPLSARGKLGPMLWQLPANFQRDDERLAGRAGALPPVGTASSSATRAGSRRRVRGAARARRRRWSIGDTRSDRSRRSR